MFLTEFGVESMSVLETAANESLVFVGTKCGTVEVFSLSFTPDDAEGRYVAEAATLIDWDHPFMQHCVNFFVSNISATHVDQQGGSSLCEVKMRRLQK